ncbi:MAG TPA: serine/threonine-protein kinase, partial [Haliangiales bacterium]|nr:serine/threonine-protein kinase [Haliangiales bacterium]
MTPAVDPFVGRDLLGGRFRILEKIGQGGMSAVYTAQQTEMNRRVAVKILHPKLSARKDLVARLRREARAMSQIHHPNVANVFLFGELDDGAIYVVMELLEGMNLHDAIRRDGRFPVDRALRMMISCCGALTEAHALDIIHRDLKPENIFLCTGAGLQDFPKLLDFGLAKVTERQMQPGSLRFTGAGQVFGTPEYMSPEQAQAKKLTPASDVYSLGVILYETLTGKLPFDSRDAVSAILQHVTDRPIPLDRRVPGLTFPPALVDLMDRVLAKDPADRVASAAQFAGLLQAILDGHVSRLPSQPPLPPPRPSSRRALVVAGIVVAFVVGAAIAAAVMSAILR